MNKRQFQRQNAEPQRPPSSRPTDLQRNIDPKMAQDYPPEKKRQLDNVKNMLTDMLYNPATKQQVQEMLQAAPIEQGLPSTVNTIFQKFEDMSNQKTQGKMPLDIQLAAGVHLFSEVVEIGEAIGLVPKDLNEDQMEPLLKDTIQQYIQRGLKDGSIDPIELQQQVEPLLTDQEKEIGNSMGKATGTPEGLQQTQVNSALQEKSQRPMKLENASLKKQNSQMQGALQGIASQPEEGM